MVYHSAGSSQDRYQFQWWALSLIGARPREKKKGADRGSDGEIYYRTPDKTIKTMVQVKSGGVQRNDIATLSGDMEAQKADFGIFITLENSTEPMRKEALAKGFVKETIMKEPIPKIEILTIRELLEGKTPKVQQVYDKINVSYQKAVVQESEKEEKDRQASKIKKVYKRLDE